MSIKLRLLAVVMLCTICACAQNETDYATKNIPATLLPHANSVMRDYSMQIDIISQTEVDIKEHYVLTILNDKADKYAHHAEYSSKLNSIESISGYVYDANGDEVKKIKQSDFMDVPAAMQAGVFNDAKFKVYNVNYRQYPYTVEYTIETKQNHTFYLPDWSPQKDKHCAVQSARLNVFIHDNSVLKYKQFNLDIQPATERGQIQKYSWSAKNIHSEKAEPLSFIGTYNTAVILLALNNFMLNDYNGSTDSWKDFGQFIFKLNKGRDSLPEEVKIKIRDMVAGVTNDHEKVKILYAYLQRTMRYVLVQYGIGGWQPLDAAYLSKNQYGDCKALSNYMMAMLEVAGIRSYPVLITGGNDNPHVLSTDFVCSQFNHCILCVPFAKDTTWLECTSSDLPANYLSDFTQNRDALMVTPTGGVLVHTPVYDTSVNLTTRHASLSCNPDGNLKINMTSIYKGEGAEYLNQYLKYENDHDKDEFLHSKFHLPSYTLDDYKYERIEPTPTMCIKENAAMTATGLYSKTGSRIFINIDAAPIYLPDHEQEDERKDPFHIPSSAATTDTFELSIPEGAEVEYIPAPVALRYPFGSYAYVISKKENKLIAICRFTLNSGTYASTQYKDYVKFTDLIDNKTHKKVVLKVKS